MRSTWYEHLLRRFREAIALDTVIPFRVILPALAIFSAAALGQAPQPQPLTPDRVYKTAGDGATTQGVDTRDDALGEVNAKRAQRGLRPFIRDEGLTQAARACAAFRAQHLMFGHTSNDFQFCPPGVSAASAGCAAYPASYGWMSCDVYDNYTYGGAAWAMGRDQKRYMHLYVR